MTLLDRALCRLSRRSAATAALCFALTCAIGLQSWISGRVGGFDLGIFDQGVRSYAQVRLPYSAIKNYHHHFPPGFSLLGDHFSPVLALLAPLYWIWNDPRVLVLSQSALFAAGVPLIRRITARSFAAAPEPAARAAVDAAGLAYAVGWPLLTSAATGFHEVAFAVPLTLLMLERGLARRYAAVVVCAVLLACTKEDLGLMVGAYGAVLAARSRRAKDRPGVATGLALLIAGPLSSLAAIGWLIPLMGGAPGYYWNYGSLGPDAGRALSRVLSDPLVLVSAATHPLVKPALVLWLLGSLLFLPLGSPTALLALPLLAERVLSDNPNHWPVTHHYDAFLWPVLLVASVETLGRLRHRRLLGLGALTATVIAASCLGLYGLANPRLWSPSPERKALLQAAALIPDGASVEADNNAAPHLTARTDVVIVDEVPHGRDYVLIQERTRVFPFTDVTQQQARIRLLLAHGYTTVRRSGGAVLLHRTDRQPIPGMTAAPGGAPAKDLAPPDIGRNLFRG
ncbi:DUF2079 domain-containing protein [Peterkaempfera bronchialis]|uniref:DUF2079 domain-containing protein n=1 Tax=Peterkaempfera bronchialis TaxID=2126346 RepID=A0A345SZH4_9ACTN|nr:DUF2079 domain-containing protein [Peterkaempfera bronchialis]AXI79129.1 DUF2079 domain-containing protein [Peterkaempfera bronchialis]